MKILTKCFCSKTTIARIDDRHLHDGVKQKYAQNVYPDRSSHSVIVSTGHDLLIVWSVWALLVTFLESYSHETN